jgi:HK97 family phage prohead protease
MSNPNEMRAAAAERRSREIRTRADRPSQRRAAEETDSGAWVSAKIERMALAVVQRSEDLDLGTLNFQGYASMTNRGYDMYDFFGPYTEKVAQGAFTSSLLRDDLDVPLVLQHQDLRRIARTTNGSLRLSEDSDGLKVDADLDPRDQDVQYIEPKLRSGLVDEMSFKFRINAGEWSPDYETYTITDVDIHRGDVAIVGYGASPHTKGAGLRSEFNAEDLVRGLSERESRELFLVLRGKVKTGRDLIREDEGAPRVL